MHLEWLRAYQVRCFEELQYVPDRAINLICGPNGSGKTTLLEIASIAALGRSFLTNNIVEVARSGQNGLSVAASFCDQAGVSFEVRVRKARGETAIAIDGVQIQAASSLAQRVPVLVLNSKAPDLLSDSPSNRRALLDRTMFHVEPRYIELWKQYRHALRQRNEILRRQGRWRDGAYWSEQLALSGGQIDERRQEMVAAINQGLSTSPVARLHDEFRLVYNPGWNREQGYREQLKATWDRDAASGFTSVGIHRADLSLKGDGRSLARRLSRGQGKITVIALYGALAEFIRSRTHRVPLFLVDDLHAELDDNMCTLAVDIITATGGQCLFSAIRPQDLPEVASRAASVFHVEHGRKLSAT